MHGSEAAQRDVLGVRRELATGVVHEGVDPLPLVQDAVDEGRDSLRLPDVAHLGQADTALEDDLLTDRFQRFGTATADGNAVAVSRKLQRGRPTDTRATPRDDGDATRWIRAVHLLTVALPSVDAQPHGATPTSVGLAR